MRRLTLAVVLACAAAGPAAAGRDAAAVVAELGAGTATPAAAVPELAALPVETLAAQLARPRTSTVDQRRAVLKAIKASVPDASGKFETPARQKADQVRADEAFDWLAELTAAPGDLPGQAEVIADVALLRALAASPDRAAAAVIIDAAFAPDTMIYRDECGRRLRAMAPESVPALTIASQAKEVARARYATYQLERLDRQEPGKAMAATAADEDLRVAQLRAFGSSHHREAVATVLKFVDDSAPRVRAAARAAWNDYVTGPPPKPAPRKRLQLPGGKFANKETPLWLTYRELAAIELKRTAEDVLGEVFAEDAAIDLAAVSQRLFEHYDAERAKIDDAAFAAAKAKVDGGDLAGAIAEFDRLLATAGTIPHPTEAAAIYLTHARALEQAQQWDGAAAAYGKALGIDPQGGNAVDAEAGREYALGKAFEAVGKDGSANFRRAVALKPDYAPARAAAAKDEPPQRKAWMLYGGGAVAACAALLAVLGLTRRRRRA
ncbi:MAG: hypothetical protein IPL61_38775 [Myxococcales bacterium]|nr:hypothetical protein [Myxococcales bacterium]